MDDLLYLGITIVAFIILWAFVRGCEALSKQ